MKEKNIKNTFEFHDLKWDTEFFGVKSARVILYESLSLRDWIDLKERFNGYQFVSIENRNSETVNAQLIGKETSAFLVDVNIQFLKKLEGYFEMPEQITFHQALGRQEQIIEIADFSFSKFTEDPELARRGGDQVYHQWLINSFNKPDKYFALSRDEQGMINGFLLHSYKDDTCVIELIAVSKTTVKGGIGTKLFKAVEIRSKKNGFKQIIVVTLVRIRFSLNFFH